MNTSWCAFSISSSSSTEYGRRLTASVNGLLVADVSRRRADEPANRVLLLKLRHVYPDRRRLVPEEGVGERARKLGLADAGRTEEQEAADGPVRVGEPRACAPYGFGHRLDRLFLADDALVDLAFQAQQALTLLLGELAHRDAGGPRRLGDVLGRHLRHRRTKIAAGFLDRLARADRFLLEFPRLP